MSALPKPMDAADVAREHESEPVAARVPFFQLVEQLRNSDRCPRCGKTRVLLQLSTARVPVNQERADPRFHCACPGGPAHAGVANAPRPKFAVGTRVRAFQRVPNAWGRGAPIDWITVGTPGTITHLEGHIATIAFDGHVQPYQHNADALGDIVAVVEGGSL